MRTNELMKKQYTYEDVVAALHRKVSQSRTKKQASMELGISPQLLQDLLRGNRRITDRVAASLGFTEEVTTLYRKAS